MAYFPDVTKIEFEGPSTDNPLAFRHYNPDEVVDGKTMRELLRFSVCYWHTFRGTGVDPFGSPTMQRPWARSRRAAPHLAGSTVVAIDVRRLSWREGSVSSTSGSPPWSILPIALRVLIYGQDKDATCPARPRVVR